MLRSPIRTPAGWHILYVIDRRQFASARPDDMRLNLVQMTLRAAGQRLARRSRPGDGGGPEGDGRRPQCGDLHAQARELKGATSGDLQSVRVGDLASQSPDVRRDPQAGVGGTAGPFRVAEGLQVVSLCSKEGANGLPTRDAISQQILLQKLEAASRRYMRDLRRQATIDVKQP